MYSDKPTAEEPNRVLQRMATGRHGYNRRALVLDDLQDRILGTVQSRVAGLAEKLGKVENELRQRDLKELTTSQLYSLGASLRRQIERETGPIRMVTPTNAIPKDEYVDEVQEWNP